MARQVLENGVILPAEYSDDWYDDMTSNLTKLDEVIGSDSEKLSSADVGAAALSNNYNDLDNLPTIPTVNDATLTIQKNGVDVQTFTANASSNVTANITVPTKTSDLTNDSNFVDTSNSAVSSGITSAKVTDYDTHIADTDIHVTASDKSKWNNGVSQSYVLRYSSSSVTDNSTIAYSTLDNTDNIKASDKIIDSDGKIFSIVSVDTANQTVTVGSALIDLALDANVVHTSGSETITGTKTLDNVNLPFKNSAELGVSGGNTNITFSDKNGQQLCALKAITYSSGVPSLHFIVTQKVDNTIYTTNGIALYQQVNSKVIQVRPILSNDNADGLSVWLGSSLNTFSRIYGLAYYYGNDNVEFSTKFVTTDTAQTVSGNKTFSSNVNIYNSDTSASTPNFMLRSSKSAMGTSDTDNQGIFFNDKNNDTLASLRILNYTLNGSTYLTQTVNTKDTNNQNISASLSFYILSNGRKVFRPNIDNDVLLGYSSNKWKDVNTYLVNGLVPSSLSLPSGNASDFIDISSYFSNTGSGDTNSYTASANGWIYLRLGDITSCQVVLNDSSNRRLWGTSATGNVEQIIMPILKNTILTTTWVTNSTVNVATARFIPCQGNV